jgi:DNA-binding transcriptional MerR regulator
MANQCVVYAKELIRQELQEFKNAGSVKRKLFQQELDTYLEVTKHLQYKWQKNRSKALLHAHITAIRSSDNLVPSKVLSKQAKLSQCLHSMEIEMRQQTLVETQRKELVELLAEQVARQEELHSRNSLKMMNQMCLLENEIKEIQEKMRSRGFSIKENEEMCATLEQTNETLGSWWWLVKKHIKNEEKASDSHDKSKVSSWWPILDKVMMMKNEAIDSVSFDKSEMSSWRPIKNEEKAMVSNDKREAPFVKSPISLRWPGKTQESTLKTRTASDPSTETEEKTLPDGSDHSVKSEASHDAKPVQRRWWPVVKPEPMPEESDHSVKSGVSFDDNAKPFSRTWWPVKTEEKSRCRGE